MYTPKLMLLVFNSILVVISINAIIRGLSDYTPISLKPLEDATAMGNFSKICTFGGALMFAITLFGFWSIDIENRIGLVTYKILLFFMIVMQAVLVYHYSSDEDLLVNDIDFKLKIWTSEYLEKNKPVLYLDRLQSYLECCELSRNTTSFPPSCCPADVTFRGNSCSTELIHNITCNVTATSYFRKRIARYNWYISQVTYTEFAAMIFADMVARKISLWQNLLQGKLP